MLKSLLVDVIRRDIPMRPRVALALWLMPSNYQCVKTTDSYALRSLEK